MIKARVFQLLVLTIGGSVTLSGDLISGGGGTSTGGDYTVTGSIGQALTDTSAGGQFVVRSGFWHLVVVVRGIASQESFDNWMAALPEEQMPPEGLRGPLDEPASDGVCNLIKYALGLFPLDPSREGYPTFYRQPDPQNPGNYLLAIEFIRSITANVVFNLEGSPDLSGWSEVPYTVEVVEDLGDGRERVRFLSSVSLAPGEKYFLQLVVNLP